MDVKEFAKNNWPLLAGGAVGIFLILRMRGGGSSAPAPVIMNAGPSEASVMANAQVEVARAQAAQAANQLNAQTALANRQIDVQMASAANDFALQSKAINAQMEANQNASRVATMNAGAQFLQAQGVAAMGAGTAVTGMIGELNKPAIAAMMSSAEENAAALQAGAIVAAGGYQAQAKAFEGITNVLTEFVKIPQLGMQGVGTAIAGEKPKSALQSMAETFLKTGGGGFL